MKASASRRYGPTYQVHSKDVLEVRRLDDLNLDQPDSWDLLKKEATTLGLAFPDDTPLLDPDDLPLACSSQFEGPDSPFYRSLSEEAETQEHSYCDSVLPSGSADPYPSVISSVDQYGSADPYPSVKTFVDQNVCEPRLGDVRFQNKEPSSSLQERYAYYMQGTESKNSSSSSNELHISVESTATTADALLPRSGNLRMGRKEQSGSPHCRSTSKRNIGRAFVNSKTSDSHADVQANASQGTDTFWRQAKPKSPRRKDFEAALQRMYAAQDDYAKRRDERKVQKERQELDLLHSSKKVCEAERAQAVNNVWERSQTHIHRRENHLKSQRDMKKNDEMQGVTGKPEISQDSRAVVRGNEAREQWEQSRQRRLKNLQEVRLAEEAGECTFKPAINKNSKAMQKRNVKPGHVFEHLAKPRQCPSAHRESPAESIASRATTFESLLNMWEGIATKAASSPFPSPRLKTFAPPPRNHTKDSTFSLSSAAIGSCSSMAASNTQQCSSVHSPQNAGGKWVDVLAFNHPCPQQSSPKLESTHGYMLQSRSPPSTAQSTCIDDVGSLSQAQNTRSAALSNHACGEGPFTARSVRNNDQNVAMNSEGPFTARSVRSNDQNVTISREVRTEPKWRSILGIGKT
eukprot:gnl/MRDRNA2_/MRDRNA2_35411_c0_seq1.p1 gnl/MRDRNA2_/MRDRNA2_35411_c0~~gnl/MRDRNA2_/MRDRNA2_35411_c0_seq1.p1  ORF type:complete len:632 (+),score=106.67 gnl/MRDRNA2_/MRDRNA2_35411_c0_seq1:65-1960(+)